MKVLRQRGTGHRFAYCAALAKRSDMEVVEFDSTTPALPVTPTLSAPAPTANPLDDLPVAPDLFGNALANAMASDLMAPAFITPK